MICKTCGDDMVGDGVTRVVHCPSVDCDDVEPDANPIHCGPVEKSQKVDQLTVALERTELRLRQAEQLNAHYKKAVERLESTLIAIRNLVGVRHVQGSANEKRVGTLDEQQVSGDVHEG